MLFQLLMKSKWDVLLVARNLITLSKLLFLDCGAKPGARISERVAGRVTTTNEVSYENIISLRVL